jgi:uncharacterized protein (TIGR03437 family)
LIASIYPRGTNVSFGTDTKSFNELPNPVPLPTDLADLQVLVNDNPAPLYFISPGQINFLVPMNTPSSGTVEIQIVRKSLGQVVAASTLNMAQVSPGLFVTGSQENGQLAAQNEDFSINTANNRISRGKFIHLYGTGQGFVAGAPPDGTPPSGPVSTDLKPDVFIQNAAVPPENVSYSGLAPSLIGVWQIDVKIPDTVAPDPQALVAVRLRSVLSNRGIGDKVLRTTIAVQQ